MKTITAFLILMISHSLFAFDFHCKGLKRNNKFLNIRVSYSSLTISIIKDDIVNEYHYDYIEKVQSRDWTNRKILFELNTESSIIPSGGIPLGLKYIFLEKALLEGGGKPLRIGGFGGHLAHFTENSYANYLCKNVN